MTTLLDAGPAIETPEHRIVFVSGRCFFAFDAMLDLLARLARGRGNERHISTRIREAREELARGTDRAAVIRSLTGLFTGTPRDAVERATAAYLDASKLRGRIHGLARDLAATSVTGAELVVVAELVLPSSAAWTLGVDAVVSSSLAYAADRLTGEISLIDDPGERRSAVAGFAGLRKARLQDCAFVYRGDVERPPVRGFAGAVIDLHGRGAGAAPRWPSPGPAAARA